MWLLDYDGNLILHIQNEPTDALARSAFYKLSLIMKIILLQIILKIF